MLKIIVSFAPEIISDKIEHEIPVNEVTKINLISNIGIVKGKEIDELVETLNKNTSIEDLNSWLESKNILSKSKLVKTINYLFISNVFFSSDSDTQESDNEKKNNNFKFLKIVALLSFTDFAFSIDSITTAVAISDQYILIIFGAIIGVLALRFTSGIFLSLLEKFLRLETAGYIAILIVGIKLLLNTLITETILPDYYFYVLILISFIWGLSKRDQIT